MKQIRLIPQLGYVAMVLTLIIWASFAVNMRFVSESSLLSGDVAMLRFCVPALVLLPWWKSTWGRIRTQPILPTVAIAVGAGFPFMLFVSWGAELTSASLVGTITPGIVPLYVSLFLVFVARKKLGWIRALGMSLITAGVLVALFTTGALISWGVNALMCAGLLWAMYTIALSHTSYRPIEIAVLLSVPSAVISLGASAFGYLPSEIVDGRAQWNDVVLFALMQGIIVGIFSTVLYSYATKNIGSLTAAGMGALSPVLAALLAIPLLGEIPSPATIVCLLLVVCGVFVTNVLARYEPVEKISSGSSRTAVQQAGLRSSRAPLLLGGRHGSWKRHVLRHPGSAT